MATTEPAPKTKKAFTLTLDYRFVVGVLVLIIIAMLLLWRPWEFRPEAGARTVKVTGETTLKATPDEFVFYPTYQFENDDKDQALAALAAKSDEVVKKLKELGVADGKIKTDSSGYEDRGRRYFAPDDDSRSSYTLSITVTVSSRATAQKVQDYLVTTSPTGSVSPQPTFSDKLRKELEGKARDAATKEARVKAEQSAKNLGFRLGPVKSIDDGAGFGGVRPFLSEDVAMGNAKSSTQLQVQPGENEITYQVTVAYYIK
jgi:uncharacterized protein YggE